LQDIRDRDARDINRSVAPLQQGTDAILLDTTSLNIAQAVDAVLRQYDEICAKSA
jgi:cytidylate kinase